MTVAMLGVLVLLQAVSAVQGVDERGGIAAKINGEIITWDEVELSLRSIPGDQRRSVRKDELRKMAEDRLFLQFARKYGVTIEDPAVDEEIKRRRRRFESDEKFEDFLRWVNKSMSQFREEIRGELMRMGVVRRLIMDGARNPSLRTVLLWESASPEELRDYYRKNADQFKALQNISVWRIGLTWTDDKEREAKARLARSLVRKLEEGSDFLVMAHFYSDTYQPDRSGKQKVPGFVDLRREDSEFSAETTAYLFDRMAEGQLSPVIADKNTLNLFRLERKVDRKAETFEEAQLKIRSWLENQKREENRAVLRAELVKQSYIEPPDLFQ